MPVFWLVVSAMAQGSAGATFEEEFQTGFRAFQSGQWAEAEAHLQNACPLRPAEFNCWYLLGAAASRLGRSDAAIRAWREADRCNPRHVRLLQLLTVEYGKGRYFPDALNAAKRAIVLAPADLNVRLLTIKAAQDAGDAAFAAQTAASTVAGFPDSARANFEHGFHLQKAGQIEAAETFLRKAMTLDPQYEEPFFFYGDVLTKSGRTAESIEFFRRAIAIRPDYVPARVSLARALMTLERFSEALQELEQTIARDPRHPQPHLLLSQIYFRQGDEDRARLERELSLRLRRENPALLEAEQGRTFRP